AASTYCARSLAAKGAGSSFFMPASALLAMPLASPSFAGRSNRITGTSALAQWAAICAPMTPAPRTATLRMMRRLMRFSGWQKIQDARGTARAGSDAGRERGGDQNDIEYCAPRIQTLESYSPLTRPLLGSL